MNHERTADCIFCKAVAEDDGPVNLVVYRGDGAFVILNRFPYTSGHLMVVPYNHTPGLEDLEPEVRGEMMELVNRSVVVLRKLYHPDGFNIGANLGAAAGAGIADHLHLHVVPRWRGDTNFISTVGDTRVIPESLPDTFLRILATWLE